MITEHLRAAGKAIAYRHSAVRWFEYAAFAAVVGLATTGVFRYEGWDSYKWVAGLTFVIAGLLATMAAALFSRAVEQERLARKLLRAKVRRASS